MVFNALGFIFGAGVTYLTLKFVVFPWIDEMVKKYKKEWKATHYKPKTKSKLLHMPYDSKTYEERSRFTKHLNT